MQAELQLSTARTLVGYLARKSADAGDPRWFGGASVLVAPEGHAFTHIALMIGPGNWPALHRHDGVSGTVGVENVCRTGWTIQWVWPLESTGNRNEGSERLTDETGDMPSHGAADGKSRCPKPFGVHWPAPSHVRQHTPDESIVVTQGRAPG